MSDAGHRQVEHTADVALELWGPTHEALLEQGALAIVELVTDGVRADANAERMIELEVVDEADRLVRWLNEVLYLAQVEGFVFASAAFDLGDAELLRATLRGSTSTPCVAEVKSVTYHDLTIEHEAGRLRARVVLDV
jgi:SHS2 domain-containing protein